VVQDNVRKRIIFTQNERYHIACPSIEENALRCWSRREGLGDKDFARKRRSEGGCCEPGGFTIWNNKTGVGTCGLAA